MFASGKFAMTDILKYLLKANVKTFKGNPIDIKGLSKLFRNQFYKGIVYSDSFGINVKGRHQAMINDVTFLKVQEILKANEEAKNRIGKLDYMDDFELSKLLHCKSCGTLLSGCYSKGKYKYYGYYQCGNSKCTDRQYLPINEMHVKFNEFLAKLETPKDDLDLFKDIIIDEYTEHYGYAVEANKKIQTEINEIKSILENLKDNLDTKVYTKEEYLERKNKYLDEITIKKIFLIMNSKDYLKAKMLSSFKLNL